WSSDVCSSDLSFLFEHDLFRKPVPTFRDHALRRSLQSLIPVPAPAAPAPIPPPATAPSAPAPSNGLGLEGVEVFPVRGPRFRRCLRVRPWRINRGHGYRLGGR